ncbi:hypothetical protein AHAS_Ahas04G0076800 [Arachis hypogaea]
MIVSQNMVAEAEIMFQQSIPVLDVKYHLCAMQEHAVKESAVSCSELIEDTVLETHVTTFTPTVCSGSCADIGPRGSMDDEHIQIDDLAAHLGFVFKYPIRNTNMLQSYDTDALSLKWLEDSHRKAFLGADLALAGGRSVSHTYGTTALTALILGRHLLVANAGDCRAVLCRRGVTVEMSHDHRLSYLPERRRVEELGGFIYDGYLNGDLSVTHALGDWKLKYPFGTALPRIVVPDIQVFTLTEKDEFLIIGCDGIWDVMSSQEAVSFVRRQLRRHDDPQQCAKELVKEALHLNTTDNLTVIGICLSPVEKIVESLPSHRRRFRACFLSEEARLRSLLEGK